MDGMTPPRFDGYELLASGEGQRLERWADRFILRPESTAFWPWGDRGALPPWEGRYTGSRATGGTWEWRRPPDSPGIIRRGSLAFLIQPTASKHLGLFPEQEANWTWIEQLIGAATTTARTIRVLNLFGYTGGATLAAAAAGAAVTHVDAARAMVTWCSENARLSGLGAAPIRYIVDDALTFLSREIRRGTRYEAVMMDPPAFGRGKGGELWKLSDHLPLLLDAARELLSETPLFLLLNTYAGGLDEGAGFLLREKMHGMGGSLQSVPLGLRGSRDGRFLPLGSAHRWTAHS